MASHFTSRRHVSVSLVEDDARRRQLVELCLNLTPDLRVLETYPDAETALLKIAQRPPRVLLVDWHLGPDRMDGIELIRRVKEQLPRVRSVVCSHYDLDGLPAGAVRAGAVGFLYKNDPLTTLPAIVREAAAGGHPVSAAAAARLLEIKNAPLPDLPPPEVALNPRQYQVLQLLAKGLSLARVAEQLCLSEHTVATHRSAILRRLGVASLKEALTRLRMDC
jgi:DNA-binding NarL/FixJ family response regulator